MILADQADAFAPRGIAGFIEGVGFFAIDPGSGISVTHNFFAAPDGSDQCDQTLSVNLPDGPVAALGEGRTVEVRPETASSDFRYEVIEPFRRWAASFDGPTSAVLPEETLRRVIDEPERHAVAFELELTSITPPWRPPSTPLQLDVIGLQLVQTRAGECSRPAYVVEDGELHEAAVRDITEWHRLQPRGEHIGIVLDRADGVVVEVSGETLINAAIGNGRGGYGVDLSDPDAVVMLFADTRWTWDGEDAYGAWERTKRVGLLDLEDRP